MTYEEMAPGVAAPRARALSEKDSSEIIARMATRLKNLVSLQRVEQQCESEIIKHRCRMEVNTLLPEDHADSLRAWTKRLGQTRVDMQGLLALLEADIATLEDSWW